MADDNGGPALVAVTTLFLVLGWVSVASRISVRIFLTKSFAVDDWLMVTTLINFTLMAGFVYAGVHFGLGRHNAALTPENTIQAVKYQALATILYISTMGFVKLSIGFFLLRISLQRRYTYTLKISMTIIALWTAAIFLFEIFQCQPVAAQWDTTIPGGHCVSATSFVQAAYAFSTLAVLSDWLYALLPIPMIWNIQMTTQAKIGVIAILSLGVFASVATLIRIKFLIDLENVDDLLFSGTGALILAIVEPGISITAASIATLRPLLRALKVIGFGSSGHSRHAARSQGPWSRSHELRSLPPHSGGINTQTEIKVDQIGRRNMYGSQEEILGALGTGGESSTQVWVSKE